MADVLVRSEGLAKVFAGGGWLQRGPDTVAVAGVDLAIQRGEILGLVGESGCGKSTFARLLLRLLPATRGRVHFAGEDISELRGSALKAQRRHLQMIFQDPYASLNPRLSVHGILAEPLRTHGWRRQDREQRIYDLLDLVGLPTAALRRHPHEFSGGQRQRIGIARALALQPRFVVADEPVSALDVSIQAQILQLLLSLRERAGLTLLFIAHDLAVVRYVSDRVGVMYLGHLVEVAPRASLFDTPAHPYTQLLLQSVPLPDPDAQQALQPPSGELPSPADPPPGCPFHPRCPLAEARCRAERPAWRQLRPGHHVACHAVEPEATGES